MRRGVRKCLGFNEVYTLLNPQLRNKTIDVIISPRKKTKMEKLKTYPNKEQGTCILSNLFLWGPVVGVFTDVSLPKDDPLRLKVNELLGRSIFHGHMVSWARNWWMRGEAVCVAFDNMFENLDLG